MTELTSDALRAVALFEQHTRQVTRDGYYDYNIQPRAGNYSVVDGNNSRGSISIRALAMTPEEIDFIHQTYAELDLYLGLDFRWVRRSGSADCTIQKYENDNVSTSAADYWLDEDISNSKWNILWHEHLGHERRLSWEEKATLRHEIGHTLGLSHPFNDPWNDQLKSTDTIMSYNKVEEHFEYSAIDISTMQQMWGDERQFDLVEGAGNIDCVTDWKGRVAVLSWDGSRNYIKYKGVPLSQSKRQSVISAETINGVNEVALLGRNQVITFYVCDDKWDFVRLGGAASLFGESGHLAEIDFSQDFNGDGLIGSI